MLYPADLHILPDRVPHYDFVVHDLLRLLNDGLLVGRVFDVREGDARYFGEVVGYLFIGMHVAVEQALSALTDQRDAGQQLLVSALYELAVDGDALRFLFEVRLLGRLLEKG